MPTTGPDLEPVPSSCQLPAPPDTLPAYCLAGSCTVQAPHLARPLPCPTHRPATPRPLGGPTPPFIYTRPYFLGFCYWGVGCALGPFWAVGQGIGRLRRFSAPASSFHSSLGYRPHFVRLLSDGTSGCVLLTFRSPYGQSFIISPWRPYAVPSTGPCRCPLVVLYYSFTPCLTQKTGSY